MAPLSDDLKQAPWDEHSFFPYGAVIKHNIAAFYYVNLPWPGSTQFYVEINVNVEALKRIFPGMEPYDVMWQCLGRKKITVQQVDNDRDLSLKVQLDHGLKSARGYLEWLSESFIQEFIKLARRRWRYNVFCKFQNLTNSSV